MEHYLAKRPYVAPSYDEMIRQGALPPEATEDVYRKHVDLLKTPRGVDISDITYESDGLKITGVEVLPRLKPDEKVPLVIYNRGGSGDFGMLSPGQINRIMVPIAQRMRAGVLASNYRGNGGSEGREEWGGADVNDIIHLAQIGKRQPWWDGRNIFMIGWSRGCMMTCCAMKNGLQVNAAALGAGVSNLFLENERRPEMEKVCARFIPGYAESREEALKERSVSFWPEKIDAPILLLHGDKDWRVDVGESRRLRDLLVSHGKEVKYVEFAGGDHGLMQHWPQVMDEIVGWFEAHRKCAIEKTP